uniref:Diguanylate cyclase (GGDEF) domain protein n=1 Tax=uncultured bacterium Contig783 TaxID=1393612 RepID=W0FMM5_9BACT|nr:diguanylate cyclase (GGDEF) domain protein [uncultured bacterium Contig783]
MSGDHMKKRLNVGLLIDDPNNNFSAQAAMGAELACRTIDANLFIYPGHYIGKADNKFGAREYEYQYNSVFALPSAKSLDIIYVLLGIIGSRADMTMQKEFLDKLPDIPKVILFSDIEGYESVTFNNYSGFRSVMEHLIVKHNAKKIGYVSGPLSNVDAVERLDALRKVMDEAGLPLTDEQIVYGDFTEYSQDVVNELLDRNSDLDSIVFANDNMAIGGYEVFKSRGIMPGRDIHVVGFDDDSFSVTMDPPLTTVEASSADLTYQAVLNAPQYVMQNTGANVEVETYLVQRSSCGCDGLDVDHLIDRLGIGSMTVSDDFIESVKNYLFGIFEEDYLVTALKDRVSSFLTLVVSYVQGDTDVDRTRIRSEFKKLLESDVMLYTYAERLYNVFESLEAQGLKLIDDFDRKVEYVSMFAEFYRLLSYRNSALTQQNKSKADRVTRLLNRQNNDFFIMREENRDPYRHVLSGLDSVGVTRCFLYLFQGNTKTVNDGSWKCPNTMLLKSINDRDGARTLPEEQQLIRTEKLFTNEFTECEERRTAVAAPLFMGEDLYGMLLCELPVHEIANLSVISRQISVSIKSIALVEEQERVKRELQDSLEQFMRDNTRLNEAAKTDDLTRLYNRRGFLEYARKAIIDPENRGKKALICYADMDNLKMVNDMYGHDDGDFALRLIAKILNDAFRTTDIIGRLGGDEFVVFAIVEVDHYEAKIKERIAEITDKRNEEAAKPYRIEMSTGVYEFECAEDIDIYEILDLADEKLYQEKNEKKAKNGSYR